MTELETFESIVQDDPELFIYEDGTADFEVIDEQDIDTRRWYTTVQVIVRAPSGKLYAFTWGRGLTECQENDTDVYGAYEVEKRVRTVEVTEYVKAGKA